MTKKVKTPLQDSCKCCCGSWDTVVLKESNKRFNRGSMYVDPHYEWIETVQCKKCSRIFRYRNGC